MRRATRRRALGSAGMAAGIGGPPRGCPTLAGLAPRGAGPGPFPGPGRAAALDRPAPNDLHSSALALDLTAPGWLDLLVGEELDRHAQAASLGRVPLELPSGASRPDLAPGAQLLVARSLRVRRLGGAPQEPEAAFVEVVRAHVGLLLDLAALAGEPFQRARRRGAIAACLAAALGEPDLALDADPARPDPAWPGSVDRALTAAGRALKLRWLPPGDPLHGLPLYPGALSVFRRHLARVAMGAHRGGPLDPETLARHRGYAQRELILLVEAVSGLMAWSGQPYSAEAPGVRTRQLLRLALPRAEAREARRATITPRPPAELAAAAPPPVREFLLEQLLLAQLRLSLAGPQTDAYLLAFQGAAALGAPALAAARVEAAAQHDGALAWFQPDSGAPDWQVLADAWEATGDQLVEQVTDAVTHNWEALRLQLRETGELGQLLAQATTGKALDADEKRRVRAHLIDLAKAVPALAIFAAPGGMLLLPALAKLLPFNLLPSAWDRVGKKAGEATPVPGAVAGGTVPPGDGTGGAAR